MQFWRRRKRQRFAPFDRKKLPEVEPLTFEESFSEGLLVAEAAGRMALKNRIIVEALRGDEPWDADRAAAAAREVLHELIVELNRVAEWSAAERQSAAEREGRSEHQHDYHREDAWNLRLRERINVAVAKRLTELRNDDAYLAELAERARQEAWGEISGVIDQRLAREWAGYEVDDAYEQERDQRLEALTRDLTRDLEQARRRREMHDELDDSFGAWGEPLS